jgi:threonylcarbamoyladenosine tRNA methylthiotransferase MtaB
MNKVKYKIYSLGCKVNQYDAGKIGGDLALLGFKEVDGAADLALVFSCAVTASAITKSRQMINKAKKENPKARIILSGCWPRTAKIDNGQVKNVDFVLPKAGLKEILLACSYSGDESACGLSISQNQGRGGRYFLKIQDGCQQFCAYCVIPYARGPLQSRISDEVISEAKMVIASGFKEIVLSGIHLGLYGINNVEKAKEEKGMALYKIIEQLSRIDGLERIRLSSIEVTEINDKIIGLLKKNKKLCSHLHIPLQSGCDKILKLMRRPYTTKFFLDKIKKIRQAVPDIAITTDVIVGFPGETTTDFKKAVAFIKKVGFSRLHVFPFSAHDLAPASKMPNQVSDSVKKERVLLLRELSDELYKNFSAKFSGHRLSVVVEGTRNGLMLGKTEHFLEAAIKRGDIVSDNKNKKDLIGETVDIVWK